MISLISFSSLRVDEYFTFGKRVLERLNSIDATALNLTGPKEKLQESINKLDEALIKSSTKDLTQLIANADSDRDESFVALCRLVEACNKRIKPEWKYPTQQLLHTIQDYGRNLQNFSYAKESSRLNNLLSDLENKEELTSAIEMIGAQEWVAELKNAQQIFEEKIEIRGDRRACTSYMNSHDACLLVRDACVALFKYLDVMNEFNPNDDFKLLESKINEIITDFAAIINARNTRLANSK